MNQQPLMRVRGARGGLWRTVLIAGTKRVDDGAWRNAARTGQHVGTCREPACGAPMLAGPDPPDTSGVVVQYMATCTRCGHRFMGLGPAPKSKRKGR